MEKKSCKKTENTVAPYEVIDFFIFNFRRKWFFRKKILYLASIAFKGLYTEEELLKYYNSFIKRVFQNQFNQICTPDGPKIGTVIVSPRDDLRMQSDVDAINW